MITVKAADYIGIGVLSATPGIISLKTNAIAAGKNATSAVKAGKHVNLAPQVIISACGGHAEGAIGEFPIARAAAETAPPATHALLSTTWNKTSVISSIRGLNAQLMSSKEMRAV